MGVCNSCGGIIGRDCFNPVECAWITQNMDSQAQHELQDEINTLRSAYNDLSQHNMELVSALKDLIFTASTLWDKVKPIKDRGAITVTHPIIEEARQIIRKYTGPINETDPITQSNIEREANNAG